MAPNREAAHKATRGTRLTGRPSCSSSRNGFDFLLSAFFPGRAACFNYLGQPCYVRMYAQGTVVRCECPVTLSGKPGFRRNHRYHNKRKSVGLKLAFAPHISWTFESRLSESCGCSVLFSLAASNLGEPLYLNIKAIKMFHDESTYNTGLGITGNGQVASARGPRRGQGCRLFQRSTRSTRRASLPGWQDFN